MSACVISEHVVLRLMLDRGAYRGYVSTECDWMPLATQIGRAVDLSCVMATPGDLPDEQFCHRPVQPLPQKFSAFAVGQISFRSPPVLRHQRGAFRDRHDTLARDAVDACCAKDERAIRGRRSRVVLTSRRWCQVGGTICRRRGQESPIPGEITKQAVKTIRVRECRARPALTCGD